MSLTIQLPPAIEQKLRAQSPNLDAEATEALLVELYRQDKLTRPELAHSLNLDRFQTDALLKKHNVTEDLPTSQELEEDLHRIQAALTK